MSKSRSFSLRWYFSILFALVAIVGGLLFVLHALESMNEQQNKESLKQYRSIDSHFTQLYFTQSKKLSDMSVILPLTRSTSGNDDDNLSIESYKATLNTAWDDIEVFWGIDSILLLDKQLKIKFSNLDANKQPPIAEWIEANEQESSFEQYYCDTSACFAYSVTPIAGHQGIIGYLIFGDKLDEVLADLSQTQDISVALASHDDNDTLQFEHNHNLPEGVLKAIPRELLPTELSDPTEFSFNDVNYRLGIFRVSAADKKSIWLIYLADNSEVDMAAARYLKQTLIIGTLIVFASLLIGYLGIKPITQRLTKISELLPNIAGANPEHALISLRELRDQQQKRFHNELDVVVNSSRLLLLRLKKTSRAERKNIQQLEKMAMTDSLTGLPNRNMLHYELEHALPKLEREKELLGLCILDLDDFKLVNDSLGHDEGDLLIKEIAQRLQTSLRQADHVFRLGGDEFALLFSSLTEELEIDLAIARVIEAFKEPVHLTSCSLEISASIGIVAADTFCSFDLLIKKADIAMYKAKESSGNSFVFFDDKFSIHANERLNILSALPQALSNNELELYLQPKINLATNKTTGFEALIRWNDPLRGLLTPDKFIDHLERSHHMLEMGYWVFAEGCKILKTLADNGLWHLSLAINLSPQQFKDSSLAQKIAVLLKQYQIQPSQLHIEITESSIMDDPESAIAIIHKLRAMGLKVDMDDFGTGHSSLNQLKRLPLDTIKIDRCFVSAMIRNHLDAQIIQSTIRFAELLNVSVVAEGVESEEEQDALKKLGCHQAQGYYFAKPMPLEAALAWLKTHP